jgi:glycosyltransferase involved in cell wall biosynthesis
MGVPVIASDIAGVPEVVKEGETGYLVKLGNSEQLASAMKLARVYCRLL